MRRTDKDGPVAHADEPIDRSEGDVNRSGARRAWDQSHAGPTRELLDRDAKAYLHQALSTPCLSALCAARGCFLEDEQGRRYLDFHGNSAHQVGYGHPRVIEAIRLQMERLPFCPRRFTNAPAIRLAERLAGLTDGRLTRVLLAPGGAAAVGIALKAARMATGRYKTISFHGSFHGASLDCISVGDEDIFRRGMGPLLPGAMHVPAPGTAGCTQGRSGTCGCEGADGEAPCLDAMAERLRSDDVAAVIAEPVRCTTVSIPPPAYWRRVRDLCDRHGALLIFDEIPTCLGRTGRMFAHEHFGVVPDILVIGKGLGGAVVPQAAVLMKPDLVDGSRSALGHYTHEKSPVGAAAALATLDIISEEGLVERSARLGAHLAGGLRALQNRHPAISQVRGLGLLVGVELRSHQHRTATDLAERTLYAALERGLSFKVSGGNVLTLTPPLVISQDQCDRAIDILDQSLAHAAEPA